MYGLDESREFFTKTSLRNVYHFSYRFFCLSDRSTGKFLSLSLSLNDSNQMFCRIPRFLRHKRPFFPRATLAQKSSSEVDLYQVSIQLYLVYPTPVTTSATPDSLGLTPDQCALVSWNVVSTGATDVE